MAQSENKGGIAFLPDGKEMEVGIETTLPLSGISDSKCELSSEGIVGWLIKEYYS